MKAILVSLTMFLFVAQIAEACPGGHLRILKYDNKELGEINMSTSAVNLSWEGAAIIAVSTTSPGDDRPQFVCVNNCTNEQRLDINLLSNPNVTVNVTVAMPSTRGPYIVRFENSGFHMTRGGCAQEVEGVFQKYQAR